MSTYHRYKQSKLRSNLIPRSDAEAARLPEQVADYISRADTRFDEVAHLYLDGMTINDLQFMQPEDLINVVPPAQYRHKLLMSILVRRYLFRDDDDDGILDITQLPSDVVSVASHDSHSQHIHQHPHAHARNRRHNERSDYCKCADCVSSHSSH